MYVEIVDEIPLTSSLTNISMQSQDSLKFMYEPPPGFKVEKEESNEEGSNEKDTQVCL